MSPNAIWYLQDLDLPGRFPLLWQDLLGQALPHAVEPGCLNPGEPDVAADSVWLVRAGRLRVARVYSPGRLQTQAMLKGGDLFGGLPLRNRMWHDVVEVLQPALVARVARGKLENVLQAAPGAVLRLSKGEGERRRAIAVPLADLPFRDGVSRIAQVLVALERLHGQPHPAGRLLDMRVTQQELAKLVGLSTKVAIRILHQLKADNVVSCDGRWLVIRRMPYLTGLQGTHSPVTRCAVTPQRAAVDLPATTALHRPAAR